MTGFQSDDTALVTGAPATWPSPLPRPVGPARPIVATVLATYAALAEGNVDEAAAILGPDVQWYMAAGSPYAESDRPYEGGEQVARAVLAPLADDVAFLRLITHELLTYGDTVVTLGTYHGFSARGGAEVSVPYAHVWIFDGPTLHEFREHADGEALTSALGKTPNQH